MKLDGKVALVTGAAGGIGQAIARRLAHEGAHVALADIRTKPLDGITRTIESYDRKALTVAVDVTQSDQVTQMVQAVVEAFGRIDIFFNNAGIIRVQNFLDVTEAEWDHVIDVNLKGVFLCGQAVAKHMVERGQGKIVNVAPFKSETLTNFEVGVKTTWNNIFRFNAAVYYEKWNNIQYGVVVSGAQGACIVVTKKLSSFTTNPSGLLRTPASILS